MNHISNVEVHLKTRSGNVNMRKYQQIDVHIYLSKNWLAHPNQNYPQLVGRICNNFEKNRALYDKSMKLGTWLVDNKTKKIRVSATPKMPSNGRHLVFPNWPPFSL